MNNPYVIFHLARADFFERVRRRSFLVTLLLIIFMAYAYVPSSHAGYITLSVDGARGIYNSAWVANLVAVLVGITMPGLGFFLVKNAISRDIETGVGQILATTPLKRPVYTIGKWLSNLAVLVLMLVVTILATIVLELALGEDRHIYLSSLLPPLIWIILPTLALVAALAILFETISWLNGGFGNAIYFFACSALTMASFMPVMIGVGEPALGDVLGIGRPLSSMIHATIDAFPNLDAGNSSIGPVPNFLAGLPLQTFVWDGITWTPIDILARLQWIGVGWMIVLLATLFFHRFDPSRRRFREPKEIPSAPPVYLAELAAAEQPFEMHLTPLNAPKIHSSFGRLMWAEMRLIWKGLSKKWLSMAVALFIAGVLATPSIALQYILPASWLWPLLAWSQLGARENNNHTEALVFSTAYPLQRQLPAVWLAGILMTGLAGGGAAINFLRNGELASMLTWFLAVLFIPTLSLALSTWSGSSELFEVVYLAIWYFGPVNHLIPQLDFLSTSMNIQIFYLFTVVCLSVVMVLGRQKQLKN